VALISGQLGADGSLTDWFNPSVCVDRGGEVCATRALGENASAEVPSTPLRISPAGSDARKTAQHRSFDFAQDFGSRLGRLPQQAKTGLAGDPVGRRENASALQKKGLIPQFRKMP